ncbi:putative sugar nucleotidyl transferase [Pedobacter metabolipauper]|uniref:UDP-N-acetylglucosamine diphosphorylase/glucosamine-1-phosphate N-acetyltransferase n=1 Tax=Pedobacter metabolipauper TaxID=425513 RepID=A0A4R6SQX0_9SPHI|nr:putative sugar nucleotidyl transferase [Pedobacter metabolipauper]TDQ06436.1 UDP-N-acetylglucosamine diphosphorylase/glucosamine-1-phosphate N-acetyltransferase [Pedobacter metabolipauper]
MIINLFDDSAWLSLRPLSFTRPVADLRIGILTIAQKWEKYLSAQAGFLTTAYLSTKYPADKNAELYINGSICPDERLLEAISNLNSGESLKKDDLLIAYKVNSGSIHSPEMTFQLDSIQFTSDFIRIREPEDIFKFNHIELVKDFELLTKGRTSGQLSSTNTFLGDQVFAEPGAAAECSTFNSLNGPIYLGKNSEVWEGCNIRGSFALCNDSQVKMGAKIYGQTTIGPFSRVGGEINNAVIWGYSSKGHEGYLGNSVMGQWCNIGADSNNSNLKNNYAEVKLWDYETEIFRKTGLQFCGLIMADHAKCGINTMFNTGTVAGVSANVFGGGFPRNFIPDFAWGGAQGFEVYKLQKMFETTEKVYERRNIAFNQIEKDILIQVFEDTKKYRQFK